MEYNHKIKIMGETATALLNLHLKDPKKWDAFEVTEKLFDKFEELELEEGVDGEYQME